MSSEETLTYNIVYNIENIDNTIRDTQRVLYFTNALRLSIVDIQQVMSGPTLSNVMWTAVQLTRVWTHLYRLISKTNQAQAASVGLSAARGVAGSTLSRGATRAALGQTILNFGEGGALGVSSVAQGSLWGTLTAFAAANPIVIGGAVAALATVGIVAYDVRERRRYREWREQQREIARSQGLEF